MKSSRENCWFALGNWKAPDTGGGYIYYTGGVLYYTEGVYYTLQVGWGVLLYFTGEL